MLPGPAELSAVNPYAVHDHGQPACQGHDRLFHPAAPGDLHGPGPEPCDFNRSTRLALTLRLRETIHAIKRFRMTLWHRARVKSEEKIKRLRPKEWTESELRRLRVLAKRKVAAGLVAELLGRHVRSVKKKAREIGLILSKNLKSSRNP